MPSSEHLVKGDGTVSADVLGSRETVRSIGKVSEGTVIDSTVALQRLQAMQKLQAADTPGDEMEQKLNAYLRKLFEDLQSGTRKVSAKGTKLQISGKMAGSISPRNSALLAQLRPYGVIAEDKTFVSTPRTVASPHATNGAVESTNGHNDVQLVGDLTVVLESIRKDIRKGRKTEGLGIKIGPESWKHLVLNPKNRALLIEIVQAGVYPTVNQTEGTPEERAAIERYVKQILMQHFRKPVVVAATLQPAKLPLQRKNPLREAHLGGDISFGSDAEFELAHDPRGIPTTPKPPRTQATTKTPHNGSSKTPTGPVPQTNGHAAKPPEYDGAGWSMDGKGASKGNAAAEGLATEQFALDVDPETAIKQQQAHNLKQAAEWERKWQAAEEKYRAIEAKLAAERAARLKRGSKHGTSVAEWSAEIDITDQELAAEKREREQGGLTDEDNDDQSVMEKDASSLPPPQSNSRWNILNKAKAGFQSLFKLGRKK